jgi:tetratricopeptide (TPR) repeat protein
MFQIPSATFTLNKIFLVILVLIAFRISISAQPGESIPGENLPSTEEQLAGQFYGNGEWQKAADIYEKLYEKSPVNFYYNQLINCYINLKLSKPAEKLVARQVRKNPKQLSYLVDLGYVFQQGDEPEKAKKQFEKTFKELDPADDRQVLDLANAFINRGQPDLAIKTLMDARKFAPRPYPFNLELAALYSKKGETAKMIDEYVDLLRSQNYTYLEQVEQSLQDIMAADESGGKTELIRQALLKEIQRSPDNLLFSDLLVWIYVQKRDFESAFIQTKALDKRLKENGRRVFELARICIGNDAFETGKKAFQYVIEKGINSEFYIPSKREFSLAFYTKLTTALSYTPEELAELKNLLQNTLSEAGKGEQSYILAIRLAHLEAFYLGESASALSLLEDLISPTYGLSTRPLNEVKLELADIQLLMGDIWEATLTYSQVEKAMKTDTLGQEAKFRNSRLAYYKGEFDWAKAQLDVLKAATSKLIANDALELSLLIGDNTAFDSTGDALRMFARADLCFYQNKVQQAYSTLDSLEKEFPESTLGDEILYRKAKIRMKQGNYSEAISFLEKILVSFREDILADNALMMLAELNQKQLNNPEKAMQLYKELMTDFPGSLFVVEARKRFRVLRGDTVQ